MSNLYYQKGDDWGVQDYLNEWEPFAWGPLLRPDEWSDEKLAAKLQERPVRSVAEHYKAEGASPYVTTSINKNPRKVARLNALCELVNTDRTLTTLKRAYNEVMRILYGTNARLGFNEPEFHPDTLNEDPRLDECC